jgi:hypothetical protein
MAPTPLDTARLDLELELLDHEATIASKKEMRQLFKEMTKKEELTYRAAQGDEIAVAELEMRFPDAPDPTSAIKNYQFLIAQGVPEEEALQQAFGGGGTQINIGSTPAGHQAITDPQTGEVTGYQPLPGAPQYQKIQEDAQKIQQGLSAVSELLQLIETHGSEGTPLSDRKVRGRMRDLYARSVSAIGAARGMGTLQEGEQQRLAQTYPDPSKFGSNFVPNDLMISAYRSLQQEFQDALAARQHQLGGGAGVYAPEPAPAEEVILPDGTRATVRIGRP